MSAYFGHCSKASSARMTMISMIFKTGCTITSGSFLSHDSHRHTIVSTLNQIVSLQLLILLLLLFSLKIFFVIGKSGNIGVCVVGVNVHCQCTFNVCLMPRMEMLLWSLNLGSECFHQKFLYFWLPDISIVLILPDLENCISCIMVVEIPLCIMF